MQGKEEARMCETKNAEERSLHDAENHEDALLPTFDVKLTTDLLHSSLKVHLPCLIIYFMELKKSVSRFGMYVSKFTSSRHISSRIMGSVYL